MLGLAQKPEENKGRSCPSNLPAFFLAETVTRCCAARRQHGSPSTVRFTYYSIFHSSLRQFDALLCCGKSAESVNDTPPLSLFVYSCRRSGFISILFHSKARLRNVSARFQFKSCCTSSHVRLVIETIRHLNNDTVRKASDEDNQALCHPSRTFSNSSRLSDYLSYFSHASRFPHPSKRFSSQRAFVEHRSCSFTARNHLQHHLNFERIKNQHRRSYRRH